MPQLSTLSARKAAATLPRHVRRSHRTASRVAGAAKPRTLSTIKALVAPPNDDTARFLPSTSSLPSSSTQNVAPRVRVFEKLASAVAINAVVARFENLAGRAAMISFLLASGMEAGGRPLFVSAAEAAAPASSSAAFSAAAATTSAAASPPLFAAGLALAAALAVATGAAALVRSRPGDALLEPVVVSLTGAQRALGAISAAALWAAMPQLNGENADEAEAAAAVDWAVDAALDRAFGTEFLAAVLGYGDEHVLA